MKYITAAVGWCLGMIFLGFISRINFELLALGWGLL